MSKAHIEVQPQDHNMPNAPFGSYLSAPADPLIYAMGLAFGAAFALAAIKKLLGES